MKILILGGGNMGLTYAQCFLRSCEEWIGKVASKGGTTEAALRVFRETALYEGITAGTEAALARARELGK